MNCKQAKKDILLSIDGHLPPEKALSLETHINECPDCYTENLELLQACKSLKIDSRVLPDNFEWKLNLQLNRAINNKNEYLIDDQPNKVQWVKYFAPSFVSGLVVALFVTLIILPNNQSSEFPIVASENPPVSFSTVGLSAGNNDRLGLNTDRTSTNPLTLNKRFGIESVSGKRIDRQWKPQAWTGQELKDLQTISSLRKQNSILKSALEQTQSENEKLKELLKEQKNN